MDEDLEPSREKRVLVEDQLQILVFFFFHGLLDLRRANFIRW